MLIKSDLSETDNNDSKMMSVLMSHQNLWETRCHHSLCLFYCDDEHKKASIHLLIINSALRKCGQSICSTQGRSCRLSGHLVVKLSCALTD